MGTPLLSPPSPTPPAAAAPASSVARAKLRLPSAPPEGGARGARCFEVRWSAQEAHEALPPPSVAHHVIIVDRSSSMAEVLPDLKHTLKKLLVLDEFRDARLRVSLLSYASAGDLTVHCAREEVRDIMRADSPAAASLDALRAWGRTSPSQAVEAALALVHDDEVTAISLHSDGFADDPGYAQERARLEALVSSLAARPATFNTIAHSATCDVALLSSLAHRGSGVCAVAEDIQALYAALHDTRALVSRAALPPLPVTGEGVWALRSSADAKVVCGEGARVVRGLSAGGARVLVRLVPLTEEAFAALDAEELSPTSARGREALLSYARACLALGRLSLAKQALHAARDAALLRDHRRALTPGALAALAHDLDAALLAGDLGARPLAPPAAPAASVLEVMEALNAHAADAHVALDALSASYPRRTLRMTPGTRAEDGALVAPEYAERPAPGALRLHGVELSRVSANLNLLFSSPVALVDARGEELRAVAGVPLGDLRRFRSYSVVSDGLLNVPALHLRVGSEALFEALVGLGALRGVGEGEALDPARLYAVDLAGRPLAPPPRPWLTPGLFGRLARGRALVSALDALRAGRAAALSPEQVAALRAVGVSERLFVNLPQTPAYPSLEEARLDGRVDVMMRYVVQLGDDEVTALSRLPSANAFLKGQYAVTRGGALVESPQLSALFEGAAARPRLGVKGTPARRLLGPLFDELLGVSAPQGGGALRATLDDLAVPAPLAARLCDLAARGAWARDADALAVVEEVEERASRGLDALYARHLSPLVFYVGCVGALPHDVEGRDVEGRALTAEELVALRPGLRLTRAEEDATFFVLGDGHLLSVYAEEVLFSRD